MLADTKQKLVESGFIPGNIEVSFVTESYSTIADGIIDQFKKSISGRAIIIHYQALW